MVDCWGICSSFRSRICRLMKWFHQMTSWQIFVRKEHLPNKTTDAPSMDESLTVLGHRKLCWSIHKTLMIPGDDTRWFSCVLCRSFWSLQKWEHGIHLIYKLVFSIIFQPASLDCRTSPSVNLFYGIRASRYSRAPLLITVEPLVDSISPRMDPTNQPEMNLEEVGTILRDFSFSASDDPLLSTLIMPMLWFQLGVMVYPDVSLYIMVCQYVALWGRWMFGSHDSIDLRWPGDNTHTPKWCFFPGRKIQYIGLYFNGKVQVWFLV